MANRFEIALNKGPKKAVMIRFTAFTVEEARSRLTEIIHKIDASMFSPGTRSNLDNCDIVDASEENEKGTELIYDCSSCVCPDCKVGIKPGSKSCLAVLQATGSSKRKASKHIKEEDRELLKMYNDNKYDFFDDVEMKKSENPIENNDIGEKFFNKLKDES